uniref:hypothetical protein n=1 Tax=Acetatifactor sp. TaxID=1872090 RepID=UPI004056C7B3
MKNRMKKKLVEKMVNKAKKQALETVGKSWPTIMHEVEVPKELKEFVEEHERAK